MSTKNNIKHTIQYAGYIEDVEKIRCLAENFANRKKILNKYKLINVNTEIYYLNESKTEASISLNWEFEDDISSGAFIRKLYKYLQLRVTGSATGAYMSDKTHAYKEMDLNTE